MADDAVIEFEFKNLDKIMEKFREAEKKVPDLGDQILIKNMRRIKRLSVASTPYYDKGKVHIRKKYKIFPLEYEGKTKIIKMTNQAPHFHLIEKGHQMVKPRSKQNYGYKPGIFMVERAIEGSEGLFYKELNRMVNKILK
ncbi:MAG: HK97 gp10 family phage protein [Sarcina sp.]